ncbi:hypothetical protein BKA66DRAFT_451211 [Pyrenochaeta sp. MPI-SDFR-AT-0127]|nr:hypothetical protein BKA66DRAFT_451211 [Pyrenochaeta sp. MPI-SDFR-AT-0127]
MSPWSNEAIIAVVTLLATCPPTVIMLWHIIERGRRDQGTKQQDVELRMGLDQKQRSLTHVNSYIVEPAAIYPSLRRSRSSSAAFDEHGKEIRWPTSYTAWNIA